MFLEKQEDILYDKHAKFIMFKNLLL
jgi:hypothetical protein